MVKYREILRLTAMGISQRNVAFSVGCAPSTVQDVLRAAKAVGLEWPPPEETDDPAIRSMIYRRPTGRTPGRPSSSLCRPCPLPGETGPAAELDEVARLRAEAPGFLGGLQPHDLVYNLLQAIVSAIHPSILLSPANRVDSTSIGSSETVRWLPLSD